ncbi:hypothetical protein CMUS01_09797 [Colletotrichum musicola]|uniref:Uncharacterized protein n=1 Tax=Colletotrichum musicola TaxID=2175873 RepID=A0A8H6K685_9PEZI|nr:hypothetical protein CMUS01_09797 [Colletotrichum musicola]
MRLRDTGGAVARNNSADVHAIHGPGTTQQHASPNLEHVHHGTDKSNNPSSARPSATLDTPGLTPVRRPAGRKGPSALSLPNRSSNANRRRLTSRRRLSFGLDCPSQQPPSRERTGPRRPHEISSRDVLLST